MGIKDIFKKWKRVFYEFAIGFIVLSLCSFGYSLYKNWIFFLIILICSFIVAYFIPQILLLFKRTKTYEGKYKVQILEYCNRQKINITKLYIMKSSRSNAFVSGFLNNRSITFTSNLIENHPIDEIEAVVAHELGHHKNNDGIFFTIIFSSVLSVNIYQYFINNLFGLLIINFVISLILLPLILFIFRYRENLCDLYAKKVLEDPSSFARFFERMLFYEVKSGNEIKDTEDRFYNLFLMHPSVSSRIKLMKSMIKL